MMKNKRIILTLLSFLAFGALTGELEARRGGGGGGRGGGGAHRGGGRSMASRGGGAHRGGGRMTSRGGGARMRGARMAGRTRMGGRAGGGARMARARVAGRRGIVGGRRLASHGRSGWRGGRRGHGHRHGFGPWRRRGFGPGWWGYGYGWPGVTIGLGDDYYDDYVTTDYRDNMEYTYWEVHNNTDIPIEVRAIGGNYFRIVPGATIQIPRGASFSLKVKASDGQRMHFATHNHYVEIAQSRRGTLRHHTRNE